MGRRKPVRKPALMLAVVMVAAGDLSTSAQGTSGVPRMAMPEAPQQERDAADEPMFRADVTRVEVSALVLDREGTPVRGLTAADFEVLENGVPQVVRSFAPFTFEPGLIVLPDPVLERDDPSQAPMSTPASNFYASASRVFALILDDLHVDVRRTRVARAAARRLVEQLDPTDLLLVVQTGSGESTGFFTRDRAHALQIIDGFTGQRLLDRTMHAKRLRVPANDSDAERLEHYRRMCERLRDVSLALRDVSGRRKTLVLVSEGSSYGAGMSDMEVRLPTAASGSRVNAGSGSMRLMNELLGAAAAGNVAIYPLNPNGLDVPDADLIQVSGLQAPPTDVDYSQILMEARQSREMGRDLAALSGGVSLVDTNDPLAGIDRAVRDASSHYVLTYEPERPAKGNEYRSIEVKVRRPGVTVLARRGYRAPGVRPPPSMKVPGSLPLQLRTLLAGIMPDDGLPMRVQAVPLSRRGRTTVAVVVEVNGTLLAADQAARTLRVEQGLLSVNATGKADNGTRRTFDIGLSPVQREVLAGTGLRSVWAVELAKGRHQLRVATVDTVTGRGGSVYLDVDVSDEVLPPGMLVASRFLSMMPTVFTDPRLDPWTVAMPTATRVFPQGDVLTVTVPHAAATPATARLSCANGQVVWEGKAIAPGGASAAQFVVPLDGAGTPVCDLTVDVSAGRVSTPVGIVFPQLDAVEP